MTASEFAFLALGLVLGLASGAAIVEIFRSRPPTPREVRLTVTPGSVRARATTLANANPDSSVTAPARGGPADRRAFDREGPFPAPQPAVAASPRTDVRTVLGAARVLARPVALLPTAGAAIAVRPAIPSQAISSPAPALGGRGLVGIAIRPEPDADLASLRAEARRGSRPLPPAGGASPGAVPAGSRSASGDDGALRLDDRIAPPASSASPASPVPAEERCAELRRANEERCAAAERLARQAEAAQAGLREAQRACDSHQARAGEAAVAADPRAIREAKEAAQQAFRSARGQARGREAVESAARMWLAEINRINLAAREATVVQRREQAAADTLLPVIERLSVEADAARITAEAAREACLEARQALAACEEATVQQPAPPVVPVAPPLAPGSQDAALRATVTAPPPALFRLLHGDRATMQRIVSHLAGDDPAERRRWQLQLSDFVDAVFARAIDAAALDFPATHPFWGMFTLTEGRDIATALASLGYRFDGLGGFLDARVPSQRDLSLAVGYAGLDPMRIRRWPTEAEMADLFRDVAVAADEYIASAAAGLTLGELVTLLGRRADGLTDLWNAWGRIRPLLLATD